MADGATGARYTNWTPVVGAALSTASAVLFLVFFFLDLAGFHTNPYFGIFTFLVLPALFLIGLLAIPLGLWRARRAIARGQAAAPWPCIDFAEPRVRRIAIAIIVLTAVNTGIVAAAAVKSVEYAESTGFCAAVCHTPMEPEAVGHQRSVHARIACASCHIGPGPQGFVTAKMGGVRRLAGVVFDNYERPVSASIADLPAAAGTCVNCHRPERYVGERTRVIRSFSDEERPAEQATTLIFRMGGGGDEAGGPHGIHWHASPRTRVEYIAADDKRETILAVRATDVRGTREYTLEGTTPDRIAAGAYRVMDCTDCHNRIGHPLATTVERAVDEALATGILPRLPFIRREAIAAAKDQHPDIAAARRAISDRFAKFYAGKGVADAHLAQAVAATERVYTINVFPAMNVTWGTYPSHIGHTDSPGWFRCHDEQHKTNTGQAITQDCETCHRMP